MLPPGVKLVADLAACSKAIGIYNEHGAHRNHFVIFIAESMFMRDVFAALLMYAEFASQFHMRPLATARGSSYSLYSLLHSNKIH